ncbi:MAG: YbjN domain-containing protein [Chloroflexota bacterium]|nr:YbjN domain-containing protein [Chloroflexota bacterium]
MQPSDIDLWLAVAGIEPLERAEREGAVSWDLILDGRRRQDIRMTLILEPDLALIGWVHYAPPLADTFRKSYERFLRWNDELPFAKFALSEDLRPILSTEVPIERLDGESLGLTIARLLAVCDLLLDESIRWLWPGAKQAPSPDRPSRQAALLDRYAPQLAELAPSEAP